MIIKKDLNKQQTKNNFNEHNEKIKGKGEKKTNRQNQGCNKDNKDQSKVVTDKELRML